MATYSTGTLTMFRLGLPTTSISNAAASCAPAVKTTTFVIGDIPIATVVTGSSRDQHRSRTTVSMFQSGSGNRLPACSASTARRGRYIRGLGGVLHRYDLPRLRAAAVVDIRATQRAHRRGWPTVLRPAILLRLRQAMVISISR